MNKIVSFIVIAVVISFSGCEEKWEEHYSNSEPTVNGKLWDSVKTIGKYSEFVKHINAMGLDSVVTSSNPKTLFIPTNDAFATFFSQEDTTGFGETIMYHLYKGLFQLRDVEGQRRMRTYSEKYALIENRNNVYYFDETEIVYSSPLYKDGKYYEVAKVVKPKLSLYEYLKFNNPAFGKYIDTQDSVILDKEESEPLGYDEFGRTIYDSVTFVTNIFEEQYFKISQESKNLTATMVLPSKEQYEAALNEMAANLGGNIASGEDIPVKWQNQILIPQLLHKGVYGGSLEPQFFENNKFTNVRGDSIFRDFTIDPDSRIILSNGIIYHYDSYAVGDSLYLEKRVEGETLVESIGVNRFTWTDELTEVSCDNCFQPIKQELLTASNDTVIDVSFNAGYEGTYTVSFYMDNVFPGSYRGVWRSNYITSGLYNIYVNDEKVVHQFDTRTLIDGIFSVDPELYKLWPDENGYNGVDFWVDVEEYGSIKFTLEYVGPGSSGSNGLVMDYVALFPKTN